MGGLHRRAAHRRRPLVLLLCLLAPLLLHVLLAWCVPADGTRLVPGWGRWGSSGVPLARAPAGASAPAGSRVVAVDGVPLAAWVQGHRLLTPGQPLNQHVYTLHSPVGITTQLPVQLRRPSFAAVVNDLLPSVPLLLCLDLVAVVVFIRRPGYLPSRLVLLLAGLVPLALTDWPAGIAVADLPGGRVAVFLLNDVASAVCWSALLMFVLVFPEPLRWLRRVRHWTVLVWLLPFLLYGARLALVLATQSDALRRLEATLAVSTPASLVVPVLAVLVMGWRYLTEMPANRTRLRWLLAGIGSSMGLYLLLGAVPDAVSDHPLVPGHWQPLFFALLPLAVGAAILQVRLFDIEVILGTTLVYAALTAAVLTVYAAVTLVLGQVLGPGLVLVAASGTVALIVLPLRDRLQRAAVRLVYGSRQDPYQVISGLLALDTGASPEAVLLQVAQTLAGSLRLTFVAIEVFREDGGLLGRAEHGTALRPPVELPLQHGMRIVGRLLLGVGARQQAFGAADRQLLEGVARQLGGAGYAVILATALQQSRERLVQGREEERRRIRRDLHDGLGPALATAAMQLEVARDLIHDDPAAAHDLLARLHTDALTAISDVRRLVDDLRPPSLDELGLASALREQTRGFTTSTVGTTRTALLVEVDCPDVLPILTAAVEVATYRIALEAVNNTSRHAGAAHCRLTLRIDNELVLTVSDDGVGVPTQPRPGVGLSSMSERAAELGGSCRITPNLTGGTTVTARLPLDVWRPA